MLKASMMFFVAAALILFASAGPAGAVDGDIVSSEASPGTDVALEKGRAWDPACRTAVIIRKDTPSLMYDGKYFYFSSDECAETFRQDASSFVRTPIGATYYWDSQR
ncbi:YHS domain-containing protein [bacterium]|nr:YHS domain-containing protein [bacterium]